MYFLAMIPVLAFCLATFGVSIIQRAYNKDWQSVRKHFGYFSLVIGAAIFLIWIFEGFWFYMNFGAFFHLPDPKYKIEYVHPFFGSGFLFYEYTLPENVKNFFVTSSKRDISKRPYWTNGSEDYKIFKWHSTPPIGTETVLIDWVLNDLNFSANNFSKNSKGTLLEGCPTLPMFPAKVSQFDMELKNPGNFFSIFYKLNPNYEIEIKQVRLTLVCPSTNIFFEVRVAP